MDKKEVEIDWFEGRLSAYLKEIFAEKPGLVLFLFTFCATYKNKDNIILFLKKFAFFKKIFKSKK